MPNDEDFGFEDFEDALFDGDYQTDDDTDTDDSDVTETDDDTLETDSDDEEDADGDDSEDEDDTDDSDDDGADSDGEGDKGNTDANDTFTIKVNNEERQVSRDEMITFNDFGVFIQYIEATHCSINTYLVFIIKLNTRKALSVVISNQKSVGFGQGTQGSIGSSVVGEYFHCNAV